ncbi:serine/threonine-protein kinase [Streptomyces sp. NBC_00555]|uniref:serine/threonine-protein kinase n=1 Tax=Streptomyces sp. NBC_00555 TaxID=2903662 RepID=UPI002251DD9F|nr:serine/threonine-protein kinase [Streptomyces sp. NBC_00555]MCX5016390.1 serine/threonine-protein kinase [Streptomyces sp. NBC_00555]
MGTYDVFPRGLSRRYEPVRVIGRGGMGVVFEAEDLRLERRVAIKCLQGDFLEGDAQRFRDEGIALARISHPGVVSLYDTGVDDGVPYLLMELLDGEDLSELVIGRGQPLPVDRACRVAVDMLAGLAAAHASGVLHRDVKPQNVRLTSRGVVLCDFGIAKLVDADHNTARRVVVGTVGYLAPERFAGMRATPASDLYGVGVCLRFMLTGRPPTGSALDSHAAVVYQIVQGLPPLREVVADVPDGFAEVVDSLCAKDPANRPADTAEAIRLLLPWAAEPGTVPEAPRLPPPAEPAEERWITAHVVAEPVTLSGVTRRLVRSRMTESSALARQREAVGLLLRGDVQEAADILEGMLPYCRDTLGSDHPTTLACQYWKAVCLVRLGESATALELFARVSSRIGAGRNDGDA